MKKTPTHADFRPELRATGCVAAPHNRVEYAHSRNRDGNAHGPTRFDCFLSSLSATFASLPAVRVEPEVKGWLEQLANLVRVDRISLWEWTGHETGVRLHFAYSRRGLQPLATRAPFSSYPWLAQRYAKGETVVWRRMPADIPPEAVAERAEALRVGAKSALGIPIRLDHRSCVIAFMSCRYYLSWRPGTIRKLRLAGEILAGAILRGRAERALHSSEARHNAVLQAVPDTLFVCSQDGIYLDYHRRNSLSVVPPPRDLLGRHVSDILPGELARNLQAAFDRAALTRDRVDLEYRVPRGGVPRDFTARVVRRDDGALVCIERDITEHRDAERRLGESEARFYAVFEHSALGLAVVSLDGGWLRVNSAVTQMLGYTAEELRVVNFQRLTHPEDLPHEMANQSRVLTGKVDHYRMEKRYVHKDGRSVRTSLTGALVRSAHGKPLYFILQFHDLTERDRTLEQVERLRADLAHLGRACLLDHLTAALTHQLLQPITATLGNVEAGQHVLETIPLDVNALRGILADIAACATGATTVIENVAGLLRKEPHRRERVDLHRLLLETIELSRSHLLLKEVRHVVRLLATDCEILGDPVQLQQVALNLVINAASAMCGRPPSERLLVISTSNHRREVELTFRDNGTGASPAHLERMFEPFFTTKTDGLGMGLYFSAQIVLAHGGRLWAQNNAGPGLTQHCLLPLSVRAV